MSRGIWQMCIALSLEWVVEPSFINSYVSSGLRQKVSIQPLSRPHDCFFSPLWETVCRYIARNMRVASTSLRNFTQGKSKKSIRKLTSKLNIIVKLHVFSGRYKFRININFLKSKFVPQNLFITSKLSRKQVAASQSINKLLNRSTFSKFIPVPVSVKATQIFVFQQRNLERAEMIRWLNGNVFCGVGVRCLLGPTGSVDASSARVVEILPWQRSRVKQEIIYTRLALLLIGKHDPFHETATVKN